MTREYPMYLNGEWVDAVDGKTFDDFNPYTGEVYARVAAGKEADAHLAVEAAAVAFPQWSATPPEGLAFWGLATLDPSHPSPFLPNSAPQSDTSYGF